MTKRMLIDATHPEETRVAVVNGNRLEEYDYETLVRKQLKGNIYLVKVTRVEPSLQAAFVDFGGNRHGFLPFPEIHPDYYRIPIADREALLAEERALAAEQAAREDEEDAAELAAQGESLEDLDDEDDEDQDPGEAAATPVDEAYVPKHTGSIAAEIAQESVSGSGEADDDEDEQQALEAQDDDEEEHPQQAAAPSETSPDIGAAISNAPPAQAEGGEAQEKDGDVEIVGGDVVEAPVYRSSIKRRYKIQEVIKRNQIMLIQISKEERGNKGAAVTSYISLPGRYCVLMPNSPRGGGVSRKVSNAKDRQRLKKILVELNVPEGMSVILRTAGVSRSKAEIKRDLDYLLRLWDQIRELTLKSTAPALIYEEGNLIKRAIRDLYRREIDEVHVAGEFGYKTAREFMRTLMPSHTERVQHYNDESMPLFFRYQVETQIDEIHSPTVHLRSGGYIVINPTEAMVSIDVNSGKATKGRHIEETALKTNLEASEEIARQLRLRDQGGLIVIDFIDMEDKRNNRIVERRLRDAMQNDRARIQLGRISAFGLLELSRQRLHPSLVETNFEVCKHCGGSGLVRTVETTAVRVLRAIEEEGLRGRASEIKVSVPPEIALYVFNNKREMLSAIEKRHNIRVFVNADDDLIKPNFQLDVTKTTGVQRDTRPQRLAPVQGVDMSDLPDIPESEITSDSTVSDDERFDDERGDDRGNRSDRGDRGGRDRGDRGGYRGGEGGGRRHEHRGEHRGGGGEGGGGEGGGRFDEGGERGRRRGRRGGRRRGRGRDRFGGREGGFDQVQGGQPAGQPITQGFENAPGEGEQPSFSGISDQPIDQAFDAGEQPQGNDGGGEGGDQQPRHQGHGHGGGGRGRDRHRGGRGGRGRGRDRHRGGDRDRQHGGHQHRHGGDQPAEAAQGGSQEGQSHEQAPREREHHHNHEGHQHGGHDHGGHRHEHRHETPREDSSSMPEAATGTTGDSGDGKPRRGWWKRLTE